MATPLSIDQMWAYIAVGNRGEGIAAMMDASGWIPLVGADEQRMNELRDYAQALADESGQQVTLARFSQREDVKVFEPASEVENPIPTVDLSTGRNEATGDQVTEPFGRPLPHTGKLKAEIYDPDEEFPFNDQIYPGGSKPGDIPS